MASHGFFRVGKPGSTSADALAILEDVVDKKLNISDDPNNPIYPQPTHLFMCIGANDLFSGKLDETEANLLRIIRLAKANHMQVLMAPVGFPYENESELSVFQTAVTKAIGLLAAKLGNGASADFDYLKDVKKLNAIYENVANKAMVHLLPPILKPLPLGALGFDTDYVFKTDPVHPNEKGHQLIAEALYPHIKKFFAPTPQ
jgi:lysophospholipase L1-like esterase